MKVAVVFIGTDKYLNFLPAWYERCEEFFLPDVEKKYLIFTDGDVPESPENSIVYHQEHLDWPYITLYRFKILEKARKDIEDCDWLVFLDADAIPVTTITEEEFFTDKPLFGVHHPCHFLKMAPHTEAPGAYEQNPKCEAYVDVSKSLPPVYWQGCLWGGKVPEVCAMIDELEARVNRDLERDVVAVWHDESHLNKYYLENEFKVNVFHPQYAHPEVFKDYCDWEPKIVHLAKDNSEYQQ